jgi:hypothetical protein
MGADEEQQWLGSSDGELDVDAPCLDQARVPSSSSSSRRAARRETRGGLVAAATDEAPAHEVSPWFLVFYAVCLLVVIGHSALKDLLVSGTAATGLHFIAARDLLDLRGRAGAFRSTLLASATPARYRSTSTAWAGIIETSRPLWRKSAPRRNTPFTWRETRRWRVLARLWPVRARLSVPTRGAARAPRRRPLGSGAV